MRKVKTCFGMYGYIDCLGFQCGDCKLCSKCFWKWWFKKKKGRADARQEIENFLRAYNLELMERKEREKSWQKRKRTKTFKY